MEKVLITGVAGGLGRLVARRLLENYEVCGVDRITWEGRPRTVSVRPLVRACSDAARPRQDLRRGA